MTRSMDKRGGPERLTRPDDHDIAEGDLLRHCLSPASFWWPNYLESSAWLDHGPFAFWLIDAHRPRTVVELGTHGGYSYFAFCQAVQALGTETRCYAVDHWQGDEHAGFYDESIYERVKSHNDTHYSSFSRLVRSSFDDALEHFTDGSIDLLHIDGRHFYEDVKHDFESWLPKLSDRAVVLFHDTNVRERNFGVFRLWEELRTEFPSFEFLHGHGLGVLGYGPELAPGLRTLFAAASDPQATVAVRDAYNRLGSSPKQAFQHRAEKHRADEKETALNKKLKEREGEVNQLSAKLEKQQEKLNTLSSKQSACQRSIRELRNSASWRLTFPLRALSRGFRWMVRNAVRVMKLLWWIMTGQFRRAAKAVRPYYRRYVPLRVKRMIPKRVRRAAKRHLPVSQRFGSKGDDALTKAIAKARKTFDSEHWSPAVEQWEAILARCSPGGEAERQARLYTSVARRMANLECYKAQIDDYVQSRPIVAQQREASGEPRIAVYTAISGGYDSLKLPEVVDPRLDYILYTDTEMPGTGVWQVRPITFFHDDPTRTARFVKTHPHWLLPEYDVVVWIDSNIMILGDIYPLIDEFLSSGKAIGAIPHPLRRTIYEEVEACGRANKDDLSLMHDQIEHYRALGFVHDDLIESNLMMSNLRDAHSLCSRFFNTWWAEIDRYSRRDQLSKNYALNKAGIEWHRLFARPNSVRNHPDFVLVGHDSGQGPASTLVRGLQAPVVDPYAGSSFLDGKDERVQAQRQRKIDVVICVHNALEDVRICLDSIARARASENQTLIIVDDGSEEATASYLRGFAEKAWVQLYRHEEASGYTKAANKGLAASTGELVILLNSDTIVTADWAEKLADAVFSTPGAGIVGPMSSAASHQSIPEHQGSNNQTATNELPPYMSAEDLNRYCEQWATAGVLPRTPLVHGFCFGVTREVINTIGFMDEEKFPRGYGEENDYCFRAVDNGFGLVVAAHTYVFHTKSKSYLGPERIALMKAGSETLAATYGRARVQRAVASMQANPLFGELRRRAKELYAQRWALENAIDAKRNSDPLVSYQKTFRAAGLLDESCYQRFLEEKGLSGYVSPHIDLIVHYLLYGQFSGGIGCSQAWYLRSKNKAINWQDLREKPHTMGMISIIVPVYDGLALTQQCVESVIRHTQGFDYEVIVVDNGSGYKTAQGLLALQSAYRMLRVVRQNENQNFALGSNLGFAVSRGEFCVFLNNDTEVQENWLRPLLDPIEKSEVYAAQPQLIYPDGTLQCMGIVFSEKSALGYPIYQGMHPEECAADRPRRFRAITAACLAIKAKDFADVEGFDPIYINGQEDVDLCLRLHKGTGKEAAYVPESKVVHFESKTLGRGRYVDQNRRVFVERWKNHIVADDLPMYKSDGFRVKDWKGEKDKEEVIRGFKPVLDSEPARERAPVDEVSSLNH